jgi:hypothetical protein
MKVSAELVSCEASVLGMKIESSFPHLASFLHVHVEIEF